MIDGSALGRREWRSAASRPAAPVVVADVDDVASTLRPPARRAERWPTAQGARSHCRPVDSVEGRCGGRPRARLRQGRSRSPLRATTRGRGPVPGAHRRAPGHWQRVPTLVGLALASIACAIAPIRRIFEFADDPFLAGGGTGPGIIRVQNLGRPTGAAGTGLAVTALSALPCEHDRPHGQVTKRG